MSNININRADNVNIYNNKNSFESDRTNEDVIHKYMPVEVETHIWRNAVIANIKDQLVRVQLQMSDIQKLADWLNISHFDRLESLSNVELWIVHEYVVDLEPSWHNEYIKRIKSIIKEKKISDKDFEIMLALHLKIYHFKSFDSLTDVDLGRVLYFVTKVI